VGQVRMVISGASVNTFFLVLHKDIYRELPLLSFFDRSTELVNSTRGSHHTSPKPCAYVKALVSFSLSFSSLLYSGKSRMLKQVCAAGRCSLSGPMRWMKNFIDERPCTGTRSDPVQNKSNFFCNSTGSVLTTLQNALMVGWSAL